MRGGHCERGDFDGVENLIRAMTPRVISIPQRGRNGLPMKDNNLKLLRGRGKGKGVISERNQTRERKEGRRTRTFVLW